jgi:uncharacterized membrane-anchored protein
MQNCHMPRVDARYWSAIAMASLFGTNLGDLYAHNSGLGLIGGVPILIALAAVVFLMERRDQAPCEVYYWLLIIIIRTGATNIADYGKHQMPYVVFGAILSVLLLGFAWASLRGDDTAETPRGMPRPGAAYWGAMLSAGVFGTFFGDVAQHLIGQDAAAVVLALLLFAALALWRAQGASRIWLYWLAVAVARTAGTAMGDWLAENKMLSIGLTFSTLITGAIFTLILLVWPRQGKTTLAPAS